MSLNKLVFTVLGNHPNPMTDVFLNCRIGIVIMLKSRQQGHPHFMVINSKLFEISFKNCFDKPIKHTSYNHLFTINSNVVYWGLKGKFWHYCLYAMLKLSKIMVCMYQHRYQTIITHTVGTMKQIFVSGYSNLTHMLSKFIQISQAFSG